MKIKEIVTELLGTVVMGLAYVVIWKLTSFEVAILTALGSISFNVNNFINK